MAITEKTVWKEIMRPEKVPVIKFVTSDGKGFDTREAAEQYEVTLGINASFAEIPNFDSKIAELGRMFLWVGYECEANFWFKFKDTPEKSKFVAWFKHHYYSLYDKYNHNICMLPFNTWIHCVIGQDCSDYGDYKVEFHTIDEIKELFKQILTEIPASE